MDPHVGCLTHTIDLWRAHTLCATQGWLWTPEGGAFDAAAADGHGKRLNDEKLVYLRCVDCAFGYNVVVVVVVVVVSVSVSVSFSVSVSVRQCQHAKGQVLLLLN